MKSGSLFMVMVFVGQYIRPYVRKYKTHRLKNETIFQVSALVGAWGVDHCTTQVLSSIIIYPPKSRPNKWSLVSEITCPSVLYLGKSAP